MKKKKAQEDFQYTKNENSSELGNLIKEHRVKNDFSQGDLAKLMGYASPQFISDWERGLSGVPVKKLMELSKHLDIDHELIFNMLLEFSKNKVIRDMTEQYKLALKKPSKAKK